MTARRRVLVVDDSALVRQLMTRILSAHPKLEVVGTAVDPYEAREKIIALAPDVLTVDIEMPRMDGLTFLGKLMKAHPMPVVVVSSLTARGTEVAMEALRLGATEVIGKPGGSSGVGLESVGEQIAEAVHSASFARVSRRPAQAPEIALPQTKAVVNLNRADRLILVGSSTGGTEALRALFEALPAGLPPIAVVQHILPGFTAAYAQRLDSVSPVRVKEAVDGEHLLNGHAYLAPSLKHLRVQGVPGGGWKAQVAEGERHRNHLPSVDILMLSAAEARVGRKGLGVILTGMGDDGARGMVALRQGGSATLGQDEATSVVYGMPKVAYEMGGVGSQLPLQEIPPEIVRWAAGP